MHDPAQLLLDNMRSVYWALHKLGANDARDPQFDELLGLGEAAFVAFVEKMQARHVPEPQILRQAPIAVYRALLAHQKREARRQEVERATWTPNIADAQVDAAVRERLEALMQGLGERQLQVLALRLQGYTNAEIAARLGISRQYVAKLRRDIKAAYRQL